MSKKIILASICAVISFNLFAAGQKEKTRTDSKKHVREKIRIVNVSPPVYSILLTFPCLRKSVVGINPRAFSLSNPHVLAAVEPNAKELDTAFVNNDFSINVESVAALEPTLILYYGEHQKKGLEHLNIPLVNMHIKDMDSETLTQKWETVITETCKVANHNKMKIQWEKTNEIIKKVLKPGSGKKLKSLFIFSTVGGKITVSGNNSYGGNFLKKAGIENVADIGGFTEKTGQAEVSMEQINAWNPDIIFVNSIGADSKASTAKTIIENTGAADWSFIQAVKDKKVFDIPQGTYSWGVPCADSPLMPLWLLTKTHPETYGEKEFKKK